MLFQWLMLNSYSFVLITFGLLIQIFLCLCLSHVTSKKTKVFPPFSTAELDASWPLDSYALQEIKYLIYEFLNHWAICKPIAVWLEGYTVFCLGESWVRSPHPGCLSGEMSYARGWWGEETYIRLTFQKRRNDLWSNNDRCLLRK